MQNFSIYLQKKSGFTILVGSHTDYITVLLKVLFSLKIDFSFNAIASANKTELDFSLILCSTICDHCNRKC